MRLRKLFLSFCCLCTIGICNGPPTTLASRIDECPVGRIDPDEKTCLSTECTLKGSVSGWDPATKPIIKWVLSEGSIKSGQGTWTIKVDTTSVLAKVVVVTLSISGEGLPEACKVSARYELNKIGRAHV